MIDLPIIEKTKRSKSEVKQLSLGFLEVCLTYWDQASDEFPEHIQQTSSFKQWRNERKSKRLLQRTENFME